VSTERHAPSGTYGCGIGADILCAGSPVGEIDGGCSGADVGIACLLKCGFVLDVLDAIADAFEALNGTLDAASPPDNSFDAPRTTGVTEGPFALSAAVTIEGSFALGTVDAREGSSDG
jgi:hypothetical protein